LFEHIFSELSGLSSKFQSIPSLNISFVTVAPFFFGVKCDAGELKKESKHAQLMEKITCL